jgi:hypothetical protein
MIERTDGSHTDGQPCTGWRCVFELDENRVPCGGSPQELADAIRSGADLRVGTAFRHDEHIEVGSSRRERIDEFIDFRVTYLIDNRWTAGICNLRMPVQPPDGFGLRESLSFFMYNQNGQQAVARPHLDGQSLSAGSAVSGEVVNNQASFPNMERYSTLDHWDDNTNAPSTNFVYQMDYYRYCVADRWREVLSHDAGGTVESGSLDALVAAFRTGAELKVAIRGLCSDLSQNAALAPDHEVFVHLGSCYYYTDSQQLLAAAHPLVRIAPAIPLVYSSKNWDFGWLLPRTDGHVALWLCDPYTLKFEKSFSRHAMRWFVSRV